MGRAPRHRDGWAIVAFGMLLCLVVVWQWKFPTQHLNPGFTDPILAMDSVEALPPRPPDRRPDSAWRHIDSLVIALPDTAAWRPASLACTIEDLAADDWEAVRGCFRWVTHHIRYDDAAFNRRRYGLPDAQSLLRLRRGTCGDYAMLMDSMLYALGVPCRRVEGYTRGLPFLTQFNAMVPDHAWNAFQLDSTWHLMDPTWAAGRGSLRHGMIHTTHIFGPEWWDVPPSQFIFQHLPADSAWQILPDAISFTDWECLPDAWPYHWPLGWESDSLLATSLRGEDIALPMAFPHEYDLQALTFPTMRRLQADSSVQFSFLCRDCNAMSIYQGGGFKQLARTDSLFCIDYAPRKGWLVVLAKHRGPVWNGILQYTVR